MNAMAAFIDRHRRLLSRLTAAWTTSGVLLHLLTPLVTPVLIVFAPLAPVGLHLSSKTLARARPSAGIVALTLAAAYLTINASWSLSPSSAHLAVYMLFICVVALHFIATGLRGCDVDALRAMAMGLYAGTAIGGALICFEALSQLWFHRLLMSTVPSLRPNPKYMVVQDERVVFLVSFLLNRSITALTFLFWPTLLVIALLARMPRMQSWMIAGIVPVVAAIFASHHATSKIAFIGAAIVFIGFKFWPATTRRATTCGWIAIILFVVPLAFLAYHSKLYLSPWLPRTAQHRVVIWGYTSQQIAKAPILGSGIASTRALYEPQSFDAPFAPGSDFQLTAEWHTHNIYLQTWYEAGAMGTVILLAIGLLVLRSLTRAPPKAQPYLYATFVTCALIGASSFSLWQPWFMASFAFVAGNAMLGWALASTVAAPEKLDTLLAAAQ
jgi:O-antigen ligase